jgi:two-component system, sensor histidine kinase LadS
VREQSWLLLMRRNYPLKFLYLIDFGVICKYVYLYIFAFLLSFSTHASVLTKKTESLSLTASVQYLEDPTGKLSLAQVKKMEARFQNWTKVEAELNFGFTASAFWIRVPLLRDHDAPRDWLLELSYGKIHQLDFFPPNGPPILTGSGRPFAERPYFDRFFVFPIELKVEEEYYYIRVTSRHALTVPLRLWSPDSFRRHQQNLEFVFFLYYGALMVLMLYGLIIYLSLKDSRFLIYSCFILTAGLGMFASNGFGRQILWPDAAAFDEIARSIFLSLAALFSTKFARRFLFDARNNSWLSFAIWISEGIFLLTSCFSVLHLKFPYFLRISNQILMFNAVFAGVFIGFACVLALMKNRQGIRFFILGWLVLWFGIIIAAARSFGLVSSNEFTLYAVQLATIIEMVCMALALADILRMDNEIYKASQKKVIETQQNLIELTRDSESKLIKAVRERTAQLEAAFEIEKTIREKYVRFGLMISHEFCTPLAIIQSQANLMLKENKLGIDEVPKRTEAITSATQRLTVMFDKWLNSAALTLDSEKPVFQRINLKIWLRTLVQTNSHLFINHQVKWGLHPVAYQLWADQDKLGVAVINLIDNAAKYSPPHSAILIETLHKPNFLGIAVTDQGMGIPKEMHDKVFSEFFRATPEGKIRGVGLGLSIVQRIVLAHEGHVELSNSPNGGACFCIWLPTPKSL